jgi:CRISPR/Cas system Type II protein with McrA/HNH and RuvC-like nuclease domain
MTAPVIFTWDGDVMVPLLRFKRLCDKEFTVHEQYPLVVQEERSRVSHAHYFASVNEAWANLPEAVAEQFPTSEHLRKYALIKAGYADERSIVCSTKAEAQRVAAFIKPMDAYAVVVVKEAVVKVFTAKSQSVKSMGRDEFQDSKQKVLNILADLVGVRIEALQANSGTAA